METLVNPAPFPSVCVISYSSLMRRQTVFFLSLLTPSRFLFSLSWYSFHPILHVFPVIESEKRRQNCFIVKLLKNRKGAQKAKKQHEKKKSHEKKSKGVYKN
jgi:hypothetical protein